MNRVGVIVTSVLALSACSSLSGWGGDEKTTVANAPEPMTMQVVNVTHYKSAAGNANVAGNDSTEFLDHRSAYKSEALTKNVGDYVQNMAQDLISNMQDLSERTPIAITNFALLDSDLQSTNLLGYQLAESFIHEMHKFQIPVVDYKATEFIRVTEQGDFALSRDFLELKQRQPIDYILTGTMTRHKGGYLINARILGLESKSVMATAQSVIPFYVVDAILPSEQSMLDGVNLIQGD